MSLPDNCTGVQQGVSKTEFGHTRSDTRSFVDARWGPSRVRYRQDSQEESIPVARFRSWPPPFSSPSENPVSPRPPGPARR